eukprot:33827-Eustigmatos_ZCMA.PRE.1
MMQKPPRARNCCLLFLLNHIPSADRTHSFIVTACTHAAGEGDREEGSEACNAPLATSPPEGTAST